MNKELFLSLLTQNNKQTKNIESNDSTILLPRIPFYGIAGSISHIEEAKDSYYKILYNVDGTINKNKIPVPKKKTKNKKYLLNDYYNDLEKYLERNESQYLEYKNTNIIPTLSKKQFIALASVTGLASLASLPFLAATTWVGLIFGTVSVFSLYVICEIYKKDRDKIKNQQDFINSYNEYKRNLVDYRTNNQLDKEKINKTTYTQIENIKKINEKVSAKLKQLIKKEETQASIN